MRTAHALLSTAVQNNIFRFLRCMNSVHMQQWSEQRSARACVPDLPPRNINPAVTRRPKNTTRTTAEWRRQDNRH